ncbi:hypothetical protein BD410DRAFT_807737 [Rickenella mellea]|uniref:Zn(2)-C6 fungal-type domain-containing protein n=1 Tax=Rickenella mellea TaxID=50990 RepID=A0A4Y7PPZ8_9AGAM|nr:hypothetical protein BD410DRAFT_807737 [Rickenella mellea]
MTTFIDYTPELLAKNNGNPPPRSKSCTNCQKAHAGCDYEKKFPDKCSNCQKNNNEVCVLADKPEKYCTGTCRKYPATIVASHEYLVMWFVNHPYLAAFLLRLKWSRDIGSWDRCVYDRMSGTNIEARDDDRFIRVFGRGCQQSHSERSKVHNQTVHRQFQGQEKFDKDQALKAKPSIDFIGDAVVGSTIPRTSFEATTKFFTTFRYGYLIWLSEYLTTHYHTSFKTDLTEMANLDSTCLR